MLRNATGRSGARKHVSASSLAALEYTRRISENENAEPVCYLRKDSVGPCPFLVLEIETRVIRYLEVFGQRVELGEMERNDSPIDTSMVIAGHRCHKIELRASDHANT